MKGKGGSVGLSGLGMIGMLIVLAIVLILVARAWQSMAPAALDVMSVSPEGRRDDLQQTAGEEASPSPGHLPDLQEMRRSTAAHTQSVEDARRQIDSAHKPGADGN